MLSAALTTLALLAAPAFGASYNRDANIVGSAFESNFNYEAISDPTHGRVNYVNQGTAHSQNLTFSSGNTFILRADSKTVLSGGGAGRNSVRIRSNKKWDTHVSIFNIRHMPEGCGTWPAVWETDEDVWPNAGETDILEGVNNVSPNAATLHTSDGCTMPGSRDQTGTATNADCVYHPGGSNTGCVVKMNEPNSYGPAFNRNGGGFFAMERTSSFVKVWFFPRGASNIPSDVSNPGNSINTDSWGRPSAYFPTTNSCNIDSHFGPNNIIINLTFCGDWAGAVYGQGDGCPGSCNDYVNNNPSAFTNAYFDIASLNVYV